MAVVAREGMLCVYNLQAYVMRYCPFYVILFKASDTTGETLLQVSNNYSTGATTMASGKRRGRYRGGGIGQGISQPEGQLGIKRG